MDRIRLVATILRYILLSVMVLLPILHFLLWFSVDPVEAATSHTVTLTWPTWENFYYHWKLSFIGASIDFINVVFEILICYFLACLFKLYAKGQIFTAANVACFRKLGIVILVGKAISYVEIPLLSWVVTWLHNPNAARYMSPFRSTDLSVMLFAVFLIIISWIMGEAVKMSEEQELTI